MLIALGLLVAGLWVIYKYRLPLRGIAAMATSFVYLISPVDVAPEAVLGPLGLLDDAGVLTIVGFYVYHLIKARRLNMPMGKAAGIAFRDTARSMPPRKR